MTTLERRVEIIGVLERLSPTPGRLEVVRSTVAVLARAEQGMVGPPGPTGPIGPSGPAYAGLQILQPTPALEWVLNHNLGRTPLIQALSPGGLELTGEVHHISPNQTRLRFSSVQTGYVQLV